MTPIILYKLGICQNMCKKLVFLSSYYGGLDLQAIYIEQGISYIEFIIWYLHSYSMVSKLLHVRLGWFQFNTGILYCIMSNPQPSSPHFKGRWLVSVRFFLWYIHGSLESKDLQIWPTQCSRDLYIMDLVLASNLIKPEIWNINLCRLHFKTQSCETSAHPGTGSANKT